MITNIKSEILNYAKNYSYFSTSHLKEYLTKHGSSILPSSINQYLSQLKKENLIFDAGRGWYSNISKTSQQVTQIHKDLIFSLKKEFPFLEFNCWSISQIQNYFHHLFTKDIIFIYASFESLSSLNDFLTSKGLKVYNNPGKQIIKDYFTLKENSVFLRPSISEEPTIDNYSCIEKILIDLYLEKDKLSLFDQSEYKRLFYNLICSNRINIAQLLRYSGRREVKLHFIKKILMSDKFIICR
ncbi:MAG: hypothetical protein FD143_96 [Ignavibacteria bacterium]|nr:MAG: hypothetical protein FD143_96 [Ignavibacteria bacterium]KAF0162489.1 MAG: hypothetical protein FD188_92 [Ignavibacteria bacterium]